MLAPPLVAGTVLLFGTGVAFLVTDRRGGWLLTLHAVGFGVWGVIMIVHVLAYLPHVVRGGLADWRSDVELRGADLRRVTVVASLAAGVVVGLGTWSVQTSWLSHRRGRSDHRSSRESSRSTSRCTRCITPPHP